MLIPGYGAPPPPMQVYSPPVAPAPAPAPAPVVQAALSQAASPPAQPTATPAATDIVGGMRDGMPYALARAKLFAAGWQTQYFSNAALSDQDRDAQQWFIDHRFSEVQDCSSSGCKLQFHNGDGRQLFVYTQLGSRASDAFRGAGPSVIAYCIDVDDITCAAPQAGAAPVTQQAVK